MSPIAIIFSLLVATIVFNAINRRRIHQLFDAERKPSAHLIMLMTGDPVAAFGKDNANKMESVAKAIGISTIAGKLLAVALVVAIVLKLA